MRAVLQRVSEASVVVAGERVGHIRAGVCALIGVGRDDTDRDATWLAQKVVSARVFEDADGKMNRSVVDVGGALLAVSQFTLYGDLRKGRRPSFSAAMEPQRAQALFETFCIEARRWVAVETGRFQATMRVSLINEGPVTLLVDSQRQF